MTVNPAITSAPEISNDISNDFLNLAGINYESRLLVGTGKYKDLQETRAAIVASGALTRCNSS